MLAPLDKLPSPFRSGVVSASSPGRGAVSTPSKPRMRKAPQRVGNSASAIFFTFANPMRLFYLARGWGDRRGPSLIAYHNFAGAFMRDHLEIGRASCRESVDLG